MQHVQQDFAHSTFFHLLQRLGGKLIYKKNNVLRPVVKMPYSNSSIRAMESHGWPAGQHLFGSLGQNHYFKCKLTFSSVSQLIIIFITKFCVL